MNITLEMVDEVIARTGASYQAAKAALLETDGDVLEAIVLLEKQEQPEEEHVLITKLRELVELGKVSRILVEKDGKRVLNIPVAAGVIGGLIFATPTIIALTAAIVSGCDLFIINKENEKINVVEYTKGKYDEVVNKESKKEPEEPVENEDVFYEADMGEEPDEK